MAFIQDAKGNTLFIVLIAIFLFGAVSAAVTQSGKGNTRLGPEQARVYAGEIMQYALAVSGAVQRMKMVNGCSNEDISFYMDSVTSTTYRHTPEQDDNCKVFHPNGGGAVFRGVNEDWFLQTATLAPLFQNHCFANLGSGGTSCSAAASELTMAFYGLKEDVCTAINDRVSVDIAPPSYNPGGNLFDGSYYSGTVIGDTTPEIIGKKTFCVLDNAASTSGQYVFMHAIVTR